ncbi:hypothetical protein G7046_g5127 [Stylonectria norvegica]|nr:hypothetical protein G7046_g5127 [Stylonectria norvegica]
MGPLSAASADVSSCYLHPELLPQEAATHNSLGLSANLILSTSNTMRNHLLLIWALLCSIGLGFPTQSVENSTPRYQVVRLEPDKQPKPQPTPSAIRIIRSLFGALPSTEHVGARLRATPLFWSRTIREEKTKSGSQAKHGSKFKRPDAAITEEGIAVVMKKNSPFESYLLRVLTYVSMLAIVVLVCAPMFLTTAPFQMVGTQLSIVQDTAGETEVIRLAGRAD